MHPDQLKFAHGIDATVTLRTEVSYCEGQKYLVRALVARNDGHGWTPCYELTRFGAVFTVPAAEVNDPPPVEQQVKEWEAELAAAEEARRRPLLHAASLIDTVSQEQ
jgi:hypothetical protein